LLEKTWNSGLVASLLERADADRSRPDGLAMEFGIHGDEYRLSEAQAGAILDLRLHRLTGLEQDKIVDEYKKLPLPDHQAGSDQHRHALIKKPLTQNSRFFPASRFLLLQDWQSF
jgi:DNA gyrase subunit A